MCGGSQPAPVRQDPEADADRIAAEAAVAANANSVRRRRTRKQQSLVLTQPPASAVTYGSKSTLGG